MKLTDFIGELTIRFSTTRIQDPDAQIFGVYIYPEGSEELTSSALYVFDARDMQIGRVSRFSWSLSGPKKGSFNLCLITSPESALSLPHLDSDRSNLCVIETSEPFSTVFNKLTRPLTDMVYYEDKIFRLDEAARTGGDRLESIIRTAGSILRNPLWGVSSDDLIIDQYMPDEDTITVESAREAIITSAKTGLLPPGVDLHSARFQNPEHPDIGEMTIGGGQAILIPVMVHNIEVAKLVAIAACRPFSRFDRRFLRRAARYAYEVFIQDKTLVETSEVKFSSFLIQLLHNQINSEETINAFYEKAGFKSEGYSFYMMVIRSMTSSETSHDVFYIASHFKALLTGKAYAIDGPNIVVLLNEPTSLRLVDTPLFDSLRERAKALGQVIGVSQRFSDILDVPKACANALTAANIGAEMNESNMFKRVTDRTVFFFWQTMPLALLRDVNTVTDVQKYVDPIVSDLIKYDADHNTDYAYSLYCYLTFNCNMSEAAQRANIHKNTMVYRIRRIEEMFNISLTDPFHTFRLHLSFIIMHYMNRLDDRF